MLLINPRSCLQVALKVDGRTTGYTYVLHSDQRSSTTVFPGWLQQTGGYPGTPPALRPAGLRIPQQFNTHHIRIT
jgi:hypothetical protein